MGSYVVNTYIPCLSSADGALGHPPASPSGLSYRSTQVGNDGEDFEGDEYLGPRDRAHASFLFGPLFFVWFEETYDYEWVLKNRYI